MRIKQELHDFFAHILHLCLVEWDTNFQPLNYLKWYLFMRDEKENLYLPYTVSFCIYFKQLYTFTFPTTQHQFSCYCLFFPSHSFFSIFSCSILSDACQVCIFFQNLLPFFSSFISTAPWMCIFTKRQSWNNMLTV